MNKFAIALGAAVLSIAGQASATIYIGVRQGAGPIVTEQSGTGGLAFVGSYGTFNMNIVTAAGFPTLAYPRLNTTSQNVSSMSAGSIEIFISQTDLNVAPPAFLTTFTSNSFSGNVISVQQTSYVDQSNVQYGTGTTLGDYTFTPANTTGGLGMSWSVNSVPSLSGPYSETIRYLVTVGDSTNVDGSSVNETVNISAVPEASSWALFMGGFGLLGSALRRRRSVAFAA